LDHRWEIEDACRREREACWERGPLARRSPRRLGFIKELRPRGRRPGLRAALLPLETSSPAAGKHPCPQELWDARLTAWGQKGHYNYRRLSDDYVTWVRQLPPGIDREMAMYTLALSALSTDLAIVGDMRAGVTDPVLKKKLEEAR
jgi:hypothetical protein